MTQKPARGRKGSGSRGTNRTTTKGVSHPVGGGTEASRKSRPALRKKRSTSTARSSATEKVVTRPGRPRVSDAEVTTSGQPARSPLRQAFLDRSVDLVRKMADRAPEEVLASALAEATPMATVASAMSAFVFQERELDRRDRALAASRAQGARLMEELLDRAGGAYTAEQLATVLGKAGGRQTIAAGRKSNLYFGLPTASGYAYPRLQVTDAGTILEGLREFLDAFALPDPWMKLVVLLDPAPQLSGRSPREALLAGDVEGAVAVARAYGTHGA